MVILRVAILNRAPYEFDAHVPHAQKAGVADDKIAALREAKIGAMFTEQERTVLRITEVMTRDIDVPDALFAAVKKHFDEQAMIDLLVTIAAYNMVSRFLVATQIGH